MIKQNKGKLIVSSLLTLLPMLFGALAPRLLPETIAVHWGIDGSANGFMSSSLIFFILPPILLAIHWLCMIVTSVVDKNVEQNKKITRLIFWIIPAISLSSCGMIFTIALGHTTHVFAVICVLLAVMFITIGNYMPKTARNRTIGIRIKWTLANEENWAATHRFCGKVYVALGFLCLLAIPLPAVAFPFVALPIILTGTLAPILYSFRFYKKQLADGTATTEEYKKGYESLVKNKKITVIITVSILTVLVVFLSVVMFTGDIETSLNDTALTVKASAWSDLVLNYEDIDSIEYRESCPVGSKINGFNSARLLLGLFENEEFGVYTRYTYTGNLPCVILTVDERTIVVGAKESETTKAIYDRISAELSK